MLLIFEGDKLTTIDIFPSANPVLEGAELFGMEYGELYGYFLHKDKDLVSEKNGFIY